MRTLVTGGAGFIGSHLVQRLLERGDDVVVLDSLERQVHRGLRPEVVDLVEFHEGDVGDRALAARALRDVDRVAHLAAAVGVGQSMYEVDRYVRLNTMATATFLEEVVSSDRRPSRLVVASSMSIYGEGQYGCPEHGSVAPRPRPEAQLEERAWELRCPRCSSVLTAEPTFEDKPLLPTSVYAITKRDHEELCLVVGAAYQIPTVALRFFNVYGPGQALSNPYTGVAAIFASRLINGNAPLVFEDGQQARDFIHVDDIVSGIVLALERDEPIGQAVNLGTGRATTVLDVAAALGGGLGIDLDPEVTGRFRAGDVRHCYADTSRAREQLGFEAAVPFERGMADLVRWVADQDAEDGVESAAAELVTRGLAR
jgi:dTDP-L-rhamnose 4-epimerase